MLKEQPAANVIARPLCTASAKIEAKEFPLLAQRKPSILWEVLSFVSPFKFCLNIAHIWRNMVCILVKNRKHNHFNANQDILEAYINMLHIQPEMLRFDYAS